MARRSKRHVVSDGEWWESGFEPLSEPFTPASLRNLVQRARAGGTYTHQQIADWAARFWFEVQEGSLQSREGADWDQAVATALDIDAQWDLYLVNTYSPAELRNLDCAGVRLPDEWWARWQAEFTTSNPAPV